ERRMVWGGSRTADAAGGLVHRSGSGPDPGAGQPCRRAGARGGRPPGGGDEAPLRARGGDRSGLRDDVVQYPAGAGLHRQPCREYRGPAPPDAGEAMTPELLILAVALVAGLYMAWTIG